MANYSEITKILMPEFPFEAWQIAAVESFVRRTVRNKVVTEEQLLATTRKYCQLRMENPFYWACLLEEYRDVFVGYD